MDYTQILLRPLISEKATILKDEANQVSFMVHVSAGKVDVKRAVEEAFGVKVQAVNIVRKKPFVRKRYGRMPAKQPGFKKAYVTLAPGSKIEFFEGV